MLAPFGADRPPPALNFLPRVLSKNGGRGTAIPSPCPGQPGSMLMATGFAVATVAYLFALYLSLTRRPVGRAG